MSAATTFRGTAPALDHDTHLGAATVLALEAATPLVELADGRRVRAELALAQPYLPVADDELLVIGRGDRFYVIGVLRAHGELDIRFPGDIHLRAERNLRLRADEGIELSSTRIDVRTEKMKVVADRLVESAREVYQRVRDLWSVHAGAKEEVVAGEWSSRAENATLTTEEDMTLNGREVRLG